ncbi:hypothetical protein TthWC1_2486 [Thermoanaerobacter thermohydrosulfuricus WC1]|uniref:Sulfatase-modifying factor enzyme-like domain-containing protein n=1 Tax=Thermoanaerobacter thermohydrosulfuricus WC1 TaxID=1198630 RepID=M8DD97_THETY|nr:SUMF1/EgtB/PvdO family nonheme iron enzyme [Thermoanaerobacter thermohydrosulfuricus]EMT38012.1 hypothetical protein TthWC1_2486 [Thermoanaerobacter thermohydrosulfuricus WC1]
MANYDDLKLAVESLSGGKNTVLFDDLGMPSIMVVVPKFKISDVIDGGPQNTHYAFIVNAVEKDSINISKYQNIVVNGRAYSLPFKDPAVYTTFDQAKSYCEAKGAGWHLMTNAEWAAIALWCKKNGFMPRGNNQYGSDVSAAYEKGVQTYFDSGAGKTGRVATGSGPASWAHDGTNNGIFDLNGNVWEWVGGLRLNKGEIQIIPDNNAAAGVNQSDTSTLWKAILQDGSLVDPGTAGTLKYDNSVAGDATQTDHKVGGNIQLNNAVTNPMYTGDASTNPYYGQNYQTFESIAAASGITVPTLLKALGLFPVDTSCGGDYIYVRNYGERLPLRGGHWSIGSGAGVFALHLSHARSTSNNNIGFRSAFVSL